MFDFDNETVKGLLEPVSTLIRTIRGCVEQMCTNENGSDRAEPWGADWTGLEPATSAVTGRHSNQLNYQSNLRETWAAGVWTRRARCVFRDGKDRSFLI